MSRFTFAALASAVLSSAAAAQQVPGRDLFDFPLGLLAEAPALSTTMPASLWNPAASSLTKDQRAAIGFAGLTTPREQGVDLEMLGAEAKIRGVTTSLSYAQAAVNDIFRTDTDPQSQGGTVPYESNILSLGAAASHDVYSFGAAARLRSAHFDDDRARVFSIDVGGIANRVAGTPLRIAASTFLFSPSHSREAATYAAAADFPVFQRDSTIAVRTGYSVSHTEAHGHEHYFFGTAALRQLDASAGILQVTAFGHTNRRLRAALGLHHAGYNIGFGSENGAGGLGPSYQVILTRTFR